MLSPQGPAQPLRLPREPAHWRPEAGVHTGHLHPALITAGHPGRVGQRTEMMLSALKELEGCGEVMPARPTVCWSHRK